MAEQAALPPSPVPLRKRRRSPFVGPLFYYDLTRLARRGRSTLLRCVYALTLFVALYISYHARFPGHDLLSAPFASPKAMSPNEMGRLAEEFVYSLLWVQTAAIFVLTPAYLAGAIAEEKERGTLELLFTTHLGDREIVLGKLAARLTHLAGVLLAGAPLLALTQLWGGVDASALLAAFIATLLNLLSVGAISMFCSVTCPTVMVSVLASYALTAGLFLLSYVCPFGPVVTPVGLFEILTTEAITASPTVASLMPARPMSLSMELSLALCAGYHGLVALFCLGAAVSSLRPSAQPQPVRAFGDGTPQLQPVPTADGWGPFSSAPTPTPPLRNLPAIGKWPLLWKELYYGRRGTISNDHATRFFVLVAIAMAAVVYGDQIAPLTQLLKGSGSLARLAVLLPAGVWCAVVALRAATSISRERDCATLEGLLTLPVSRRALLGAKWVGSILYSRFIGFLLMAVLVAEMLTRDLHPIGATLLVMGVAAHIAFVASLGVWLSLASRTTLWARVTMALVLLVFLGIGLRALLPDVRRGPLPPLAISAEPWSTLPWDHYVAEVGANAPGMWWFLTFSRSEYSTAVTSADARFAGRLIVAACGIVGYGLAARLLWGLACLRFQGEQKR